MVSAALPLSVAFPTTKPQHDHAHLPAPRRDLHGQLEARLLHYKDGKEESLGYSLWNSTRRKVPVHGQLVLLCAEAKGSDPDRRVEFQLDIAAQAGVDSSTVSTSLRMPSPELLQSGSLDKGKTTLPCETGQVAVLDTWSAIYKKELPREGSSTSTPFWELRRQDLLKQCRDGVEGLALVVSVKPDAVGK